MFNPQPMDQFRRIETSLEESVTEWFFVVAGTGHNHQGASFHYHLPTRLKYIFRKCCSYLEISIYL